MAYNTGQCLPVNIVAQEFIEYVGRTGSTRQHHAVDDKMLCNLQPEALSFLCKKPFEGYGKGFEKAAVYYGELTHLKSQSAQVIMLILLTCWGDDCQVGCMSGLMRSLKEKPMMLSKKACLYSLNLPLWGAGRWIPQCLRRLHLFV